MDLHLRAKIIDLLEENVGVNVHDLGFGNGFLHVTPKAQATKEKLDTLGLVEIKTLCSPERIKNNPRNG